MKNNGIIYKFFIITAIIFLLGSCQQDVIFYDIAQEIEYEDPIVQGNIFSMVPCEGQLFVQNNSIFSKAWNANRNSSKKWTQLESLPESGKPVVRLASDASYLYALVINNSNDTTGSVYAAQVTSTGIGEWTAEPVASDVQELYDNKVFNSDGTTTGRNAYFTTNNRVVKKLNGAGVPEQQTVTDVIGNTDSYIRAAGSDGTQDYFSSKDVFAVVQKSGETYIYTSFDGNTPSPTATKALKYKHRSTDSDPWSAWLSGGTTNSIITVLTANGNDELLIGTQAGYETSAIASDGKPANGVTPSGSNNNAESAFGTRYVTGIWAYGDAGTLYISVIGVEHSQFNKLWGFYNSDDKKWNYE
ncbi:MAG: hypothetical protein K5751_11225 [Treponemataceae bacterium]|nr:hypothetical protein [Treponemataceae bacterium]